MEFWPIIKVIRNFDQIPKLILFILLNEISPLISYLFQWKWLLLCLFSRMHTWQAGWQDVLLSEIVLLQHTMEGPYSLSK